MGPPRARRFSPRERPRQLPIHKDGGTRAVSRCYLGSNLGSPIVAMVQPAEAVMRNDATSSHGANSAPRCFLPESKMRAVFVVVANVFREQTFEMASVYRDDVIQQITPAALDLSFRDSVLPWTLERSPNTADSHRPNRGWNFRPILPIAVEDEKPRGRLERKRFP